MRFDVKKILYSDSDKQAINHTLTVNHDCCYKWLSCKASFFSTKEILSTESTGKALSTQKMRL